MLRHLSYKGKLVLNFTLLFILFAAVLVVFQQHRERTFRRELLEARLRSYADLAANVVEEGSADSVGARLHAVDRAMPPELRLTIVGRRGDVRFESDTAAAASPTNHMTRPEVQAALANAEGYDIRQSETTGVTYFYYAKTYGRFVVRVALPYTAPVKHFMKADNVYLWFALLVFALALVIVIRVSDHFGRAVSSLRQFISSAERGLVDYDHITFPHSELGDVSRSIMEKYRQTELTGRRIAEERERLMRHFHYFEEGIAVFTPERKKIYANPRFFQYVNTLLDAPTPDVNTIWNHDVFRPATEFLNLSGGRRTDTAEAPVFRFTKTAGGTFFAIRLLVYADGSFEMTLADITRAEKARLLKQQMSNNITHELRTPVSSIRGYIETVLTATSLREEQRRRFLEKALAQSVRLTDLIRDVALISKTEEAPDMMPRERLDVAEIVGDVLEELRQGLDAAEMKAENRIPADTVVNGNHALLHSIFRNLTENSIRYAGRATTVCYECYRRDDEYCYFRYYDTGCGVPDEHLPRLFERFYRITEGRTRDCGGTGLGLSIVRNAVLFHSGTISVRNRVGGGLEFLFTIKR